MNLVGDQPVCISVHGYRSFFAGRLGKTEDGSGLLVEPPTDGLHSMLILYIHALLVGFWDRPSGGPWSVVNVHE
jgi:hypothetical protein